jgi:TRAP transporter TAXI family solute receptor
MTTGDRTLFGLPWQIVAALVGVIALVACERSPKLDKPRALVRFTRGIPGASPSPAGFDSLSGALSVAYERALPRLDLEIRESAGSLHTLQQIQRGQADIGFALADVAYVAFSHGIAEAQDSLDRLRAIAALELTSLQMVVRRHSGIRSVPDVRGRRVGIGPTGSGTVLTSGLILRAYGIGENEITTIELPWNEAARRLVNGTLDAAFVNAGYPSESVAEAAHGGATLLDIAGPAVDRLRSSYPFYRLTFIPSGTYPGQLTPIRTIGVSSVLVTRVDLDEEVVYELTRALFEIYPEIAAQRVSMELVPEEAPATPIPLHEGAARYYRERELTR